MVAALSLLVHAAILAWLGLRAPEPQYREPLDEGLIEMQLSAEIAARLRRSDPQPRRAKTFPFPPLSNLAPAPPEPQAPAPPVKLAPESVVVDLRAALRRAGIGCAMTLKGEELAECQDRLAARAADRGALPVTAGANPEAGRAWDRSAARKEAYRQYRDANVAPGTTKDNIGKAKDIPF
ncbi:hypothetical protein [Caulobacter sp. NIBR2454]|uniref:hypothetical protein n=1 Tax=Caulobacter sp. NIBR2454 TaxID=3015996 RepID=UPI0022B5F74E|nr:hypothetical protein [Caulobacter sp. NIBR2454]